VALLARQQRIKLGASKGRGGTARGTELTGSPQAGQARMRKASTRNSIISRTLGETNLREG